MSILKKIIVGVTITGCVLGATNNYKINSQQTLEGVAITNNYIEFKDGTGWYLENEIVKEGKSYKVTINTNGTENIEDDTIISIK